MREGDVTDTANNACDSVMVLVSNNFAKLLEKHQETSILGAVVRCEEGLHCRLIIADRVGHVDVLKLWIST